MYSGEGNLILPILDHIKQEDRINFFENHIFLSDIQLDMVEKSIENAQSYGIPYEIAKKRIIQRDNLASYPTTLLKEKFPVYQITNPPYLYLGYIRKHTETEVHLKYFINENDGYQDLYQIAMINDLRNGIKNVIYIIPSNFLYGNSVSNKIREDFFKYYNVEKMYIFEKKMFEFTGTNTCIGFFKRKTIPKVEKITFSGIKFTQYDKSFTINYALEPGFKYRGGSEFETFTKTYKAKKPIKVKYYLLWDEVSKNRGQENVKVIDTNNYKSNEYLREELKVNEDLKNKIKSNVLYVRTVDTGKFEGRAGLYLIKEDFDVDGIFVSKATYRTCPIQLFFEPELKYEEQIMLKDYFNLMLEHFREKLDSEFMTTYKYSGAKYTRKYLGLTQVRQIIETFPIITLTKPIKEDLQGLIKEKNITAILEILKSTKNKLEKSKNNLLNWI